MSMKVFDAYGLYYDLLYKDKDYRGESEYVHTLLKSYRPGAKTILELGSGTGMHACLLAQKGYHVSGVDQSDNMLRMAEKRRAAENPAVRQNTAFAQGDIRDYNDGNKYDAVIALFHVMSYMRTDNDLLRAFDTACRHLGAGGIFIFDCWHGPGVLHDKPVSREKRFADEHTAIRRSARPVMHADEHLVDVIFNIEVKDKQSDQTHILQETHTMHYLFTEEIAALCKRANCELVAAEEWLTRKPLSNTSWNACYVCKKS